MQNDDTTVTSGTGPTREEARALTERVLSLSTADAARVGLSAGRRRFVRSADNRITSAGEADDVTLTITSVFGRRVASVTTNLIDDQGIRDAVLRSESLARLAPENPELMPELGPQTYADVRGAYATTANATPDALADAAAQGIESARRSDNVAAGFIDLQSGVEGLATSQGLFAYHAGTGVASTLTVRSPDGATSGWAGDEAADWSRIDTPRVAADAAAKCVAWRQATALDPGSYDVVLEPTAVGMLMLRLRTAFDARAADEGRSFFSDPGGGNRIGQPLFDPRVTISSDPGAAGAETAPYNETGVPRAALTWVDGGTLANLAYSRFWADRQERASLPSPANLVMAGGTDTPEDMIASTRRGVLVTRFWYIRPLNPRTLAYTGLTRDGTFLIENGRISRPVNNFRFNQSLVEMLRNIELIGPAVRVAASESSSVGAPMVVPPLKVRGFTLSSISDAI